MLNYILLKFCGLGLLVFIVVSPIYKHLCHGVFSFHYFYSNIPTIPLTFHFSFSPRLDTLDSPAIRLVEIYRNSRYNRNIGIIIIILVYLYILVYYLFSYTNKLYNSFQYSYIILFIFDFII